MIVDDDHAVHTITAKILNSFEGTVFHCHDGEEALDLAQQVVPDLIITDALLPKLDGRELTRILKQSPQTRRIKIAVMTGLYKGARYRTEAFRDFNVDAYLEKPIDASRFRSLIETLRLKAA